MPEQENARSVGAEPGAQTRKNHPQSITHALIPVHADDYVTLIETRQACNKVVTKGADGSLSKKPASPVYDGVAKTVPVPDQAAMVGVLQLLSEASNRTLVLGYVHGTEDGTPYCIASRKRLCELLGIDDQAGTAAPAGLQLIGGERYATRTKENFTASTWTLFDYDRVKGMPDSMQFHDPLDWWARMLEFVPGLVDAGAILCPSTSARVLVDGKPAFDGGGWHAYVQIEDGSDRARFGADLLITAMTNPRHGFARPKFASGTDEIIGRVPWAVYDPSTFGPERLVYDGKPALIGPGLSLAPASFNAMPGTRLNTRALVVDEAASEKVERYAGLKVERSKRDDGFVNMLLDESSLKLDTVVETEAGPMTVREFRESNHTRLRAQATFRPDSTSWAAYLGRHEDDSPFLYDSGLSTKYLLCPADKQPAQAPRPPFKLTHVSALLTEPEPLQHLLADYLSPEGLSFLIGPPASGKSLTAIDWACCIATGIAWHGHDTKQGGVVILAGEGHFGIRRRLKAWELHNGIPLANAPLAVSDRGASLTEIDDVNAVLDAIDAFAQVHGKPALIIVDTLHRNFGAADENSAQDMGRYFANLDLIRGCYGCQILTVHHSGHMDSQRGRGSSAIRAAVDTEFLVTPKSEGTFTLACSKMKDGPRPVVTAFAITEVSLPWLDTDGFPETSVTISPTDAKQLSRGKPMPQSVRYAVETLAQATKEHGDGGAVHVEQWRAIFYKGHTADNTAAKKVAFQRVRADLVNADAVEVADDCYRLTDCTGTPWIDAHGFVVASALVAGAAHRHDNPLQRRGYKAAGAA